MVRREEETPQIASFYLKPQHEETSIAPFEAGQYLSVRIGKDTPVKGHEEGHDLVRNYSVSCAPGEGHYRISVKREDGGLVSNHLHDVVKEGSVLEVSEEVIYESNDNAIFNTT